MAGQFINAPSPSRREARNFENELDIVIVGNKSDKNVTSGQYVTVRDSSITGITNGIYKATANVAAGTAFVAANLDAVTSGALNDLNGNISSINTKLGTNVVYRGTDVATGKNSCTVDSTASYTRALKGCGIVLLELRITCSTFSSETVIATLASGIRPFADVTYIKTFDMWGTAINGIVTIRSGGDIAAQPVCSGKNIQIVVAYPVVP